MDLAEVCERNLKQRGLLERDSKEQCSHSDRPSSTRLVFNETRSQDATPPPPVRIGVLDGQPAAVAAHPETQLLKTRSPSERAWRSVREV
jgi:hypothetical protein